MWIVEKIADFFTHDASTRVEHIEHQTRELSHDLTNVAARVDVLTRMHRNMRDDRVVNGDATKKK